MKDESSDAYAQAVVFTALVGSFSLILLLLRGGFKTLPTWNELPLFLAVTVLTAVAMIFTFKGLKFIGASEHAVLLTSSRLWVILGAILFLQEALTTTKLIGATAIIFGVVLAQWEKKLVINVGIIYVLFAAMLFAGGEILAYFIVRDFDVLSFMVFASLLVTTSLIIFRPGIIKKLSFYFVPKRALNVLVTSVNDALANIFGFAAYQVGRNALQIGPLMATNTILTVILALVILKEKDRMLQKTLGGISAMLGTILLL